MSDYYSQSNVDTAALIKVLLSAFKANFWKMLLAAGLAGFFAVLYMKSLDPEYEASAVLYVAPKQSAVFDFRELMMQRRDPAYQQTQIGIILSRRLVEQVVTELQLDKNIAFMESQPSLLGGLKTTVLTLFVDEPTPVSDALRRRAAVEKLRSVLAVRSQRDSYLVDIVVTLKDPELAADVANTLANAYVTANYESERDDATKSEQWLIERLQGVRKDLEIAERELQAFKEDQQIVGGSQMSDGLATQELDLIGSQLIQAREKRLALEALYQQIISTEAAGGDLQGIAAVQLNETLQGTRQELLQLQRRKAELSRRYGPEHQKMISLNSEVHATQQNLNTQINRIIASVKTDYELAKESETYLEQALTKSTGRLQSLGRKQFELRDYEQRVKTQREIYQAFLERLNKNRATGDGINTNVRLTDPALPPLSAKSNKSNIIVLLVMIFAAGAILVIGIMIEFFDNSVASNSDIETKLGVFSLGLIPSITELDATDERPDIAHHYYSINKYSMYAEAVRTLRSSLMLSAVNAKKQRFLFTSTVPSEGKTSLAVSSAVAFGQVRKTLLIDGDLRKPSVQKIFAEQSDRRYLGLSDLCIGTGTVETCIHHSNELGIDILPAGTVTPNPQELFCSTSFSEVLNQLSDIYDIVVIDSPPSGGLSDAALLASHVDQVIYVVRANDTPIVRIRASIKRLVEMGAPLKGVVLNRVDASEEQFSYYYNAYGQNPEAEADLS